MSNNIKQREDLLYKLTGTYSPKFMTERENVMIDKFIEILNEQQKVEQDKDIDYQTFAKKYKNPYTELESKERIRALEERLFSNEWALVEVRATRDILIKLNDVANTVNKELLTQLKNVTQEYEYALTLIAEAGGFYYSENNFVIETKKLIEKAEKQLNQ